MKEKDTKKQQQIDFDKLLQEKSIEIEVKESTDFLIMQKLDLNNEQPELLQLRFLFAKQNVSSDIFIRLVLVGMTKIDLRVVIFAPNAISGISSKLDMRALMLSEDSSIQFVPTLEIDEKEVSVDHKSAIGRPDRAMLQYMLSRGVNEKAAIGLIADAYLRL
ncbi:MAG: SufD family Fe-S cluster assembly protein [Candidatus Dojkabacteria bacterium]|nr:MAG: SufD family Fe-S cluster assembly protein [Candidatus Dojkabacteria bacterium]